MGTLKCSLLVISFYLDFLLHVSGRNSDSHQKASSTNYFSSHVYYKSQKDQGTYTLVRLGARINYVIWMAYITRASSARGTEWKAIKDGLDANGL